MTKITNFFIRDPILFPNFIHTQKRNPVILMNFQ